MRGILMALRIAVATGRLLLVHQTTPAALQHFLVSRSGWLASPGQQVAREGEWVGNTVVPHLIDWGVRAEELPDLQQRVMHTTNARVCGGFVPYVWDNYSCALYTMSVALGQEGQTTRELRESRGVMQHTATAAAAVAAASAVGGRSSSGQQQLIANGSIHNLTTQFLFVEMNDNPTERQPGLVDLLSSPLAKHCAFTALFAASPATIEATAAAPPGKASSTEPALTSPRLQPRQALERVRLVSLVVAVVLLQAADRHLALLGMRDAGVPFTVLHLRLGGSLGEAKASYYHKDPVAVEEVVEAVACAKAFAKAFARHPTPGMTSLEKMNTSKLVLITDNIELRRLVADKRFMPGLVSVGAGRMAVHGIVKQPLFATGPLMAGQTGPDWRLTVPSTPVHWELHVSHDLAPLMEVMADLLVMARATCLIHSHSGFSRTAAIWSGTSCNHELKQGASAVALVRANYPVSSLFDCRIAHGERSCSAHSHSSCWDAATTASSSTGSQTS
ncbi:hypothetical protein QJQ45_028487 [Haematococcus lacustris]|nr:hypothetical protein QJQ45_028487 [Haematococcus lacustris]